jgi:hypothetical protein
MDHRPPDIVAGVAYVMQNADEDYAMKILFENAKTLI